MDVSQLADFVNGVATSVPTAIIETSEGIAHILMHPIETYEGVKQLLSSGNILGTVQQAYIQRFDKLEADYQRAGQDGAYNAGLEYGKILTDVVGLAAGGAGIAKGGIKLTEKLSTTVAKGSSKLPVQKPTLGHLSSNNALPKDYSAAAEGVVIGPKGATYRPTGQMDANGNLIYSRTSESGTTRYHTLSGENKQVGSPNTNTHNRIGQNSARGKAFECDGLCALGVNKNTQRLSATLQDGTHITVIPDAMGKTLIEIKDAQYVTMSNQFRGYAKQKKPIELIVSPKTQAISKKVQDIIKESKGSIQVYDPATSKFKLWVPK